MRTIVFAASMIIKSFSLLAVLTVSVYAVDVEPPHIEILSPGRTVNPNSWVTGNIYLVAHSTDNAGVSHVNFYIDDVAVASATRNGSIYTATLDTFLFSRATHTLTAHAIDNAGNMAMTSGREIYFFNQGPPAATLTYDSRPQVVVSPVLTPTPLYDTDKYSVYPGGPVDYDIADIQLNAYRSDSGIVAWASHLFNRRLTGQGLGWNETLTQSTHVSLQSNLNPDPAEMDDGAWIGSTWTDDGTNIAAIVHVEYHGEWHLDFPGNEVCAQVQGGVVSAVKSCRYVTLMLYVSSDGGQTFHRASRTPIAAAPVVYVPSANGLNTGIQEPSNMVEFNGHKYVFAQALNRAGHQPAGSILLRAENPFDPDSWEVFTGTGGFKKSAFNPYTQPATDWPVGKVLPNIGPTLVWKVLKSTGAGRRPFVAVVNYLPDVNVKTLRLGTSVSYNLIDWTPIQPESNRPSSLVDPDKSLSWIADATGWRNGVYHYPSLIDPASARRNFDDTSDTPLLYATYLPPYIVTDRRLVRFQTHLSWESRDIVPPIVEITSPLNGASVGGTVPVNIETTDNTGISRVVFFLDGIVRGMDFAPPYSFSWNTESSTAGTHALTVRAYDAASNASEALALVVIDRDRPTIHIEVPSANTPVILPQTARIIANASDNVGVTKVWFTHNDIVVSTETAVPYEYNWSITAAENGQHNWSATAFDAQGNSSTTAVVPVSVNIDVTPPRVEINEPTPASTYRTPRTVPIAVAATDNVGVAKVWFALDGVTVATDTVAPYVYEWSVTTDLNGHHLWSATAFDAIGSSRTETVSVTVAIPTVPEGLEGARAYPSPFRPGDGASGILFDRLPVDQSIQLTTIDGRPLRTLRAGADGKVYWDLTNDAGDPVASGVYVAIIEREGNKKRLKVVVNN